MSPGAAAPGHRKGAVGGRRRTLRDSFPCGTGHEKADAARKGQAGLGERGRRLVPGSQGQHAPGTLLPVLSIPWSEPPLASAAGSCPSRGAKAGLGFPPRREKPDRLPSSSVSKASVPLAPGSRAGESALDGGSGQPERAAALPYQPLAEAASEPLPKASSLPKALVSAGNSLNLNRNK